MPSITGAASLIFGIITLAYGALIIAFPKLLSWMVGAYLITVGLAVILSRL